jgi:hypothetical protein
MENNRRSFFKGLAAFASGVVAAKASTYIPKKEEKKETVFVPSALTIMHEGKEFHPLVVEKTEKDKVEFKFADVHMGNTLMIQQSKQTIREANI